MFNIVLYRLIGQDQVIGNAHQRRSAAQRMCIVLNAGAANHAHRGRSPELCVMKLSLEHWTVQILGRSLIEAHVWLIESCICVYYD